MDFWKDAYRYYNKHQALFILFAVTAFVACIFLPLAIGGDNAGLVFFLMFALYAIYAIVIGCIFTLGKKAATRAQSNFYLKYDKHNINTLVVLRREPVNAEILSLERYMETYSKYHPATATITAVNVGGVTTGGVDVKEAYYSTEAGSKTDRYNLCIRLPENKYAEKTYPVYRIELTKEDMEIAKSKPEISKYFENDCLILRHKTSASDDLKLMNSLSSNVRDINVGLNKVMKGMTETKLFYSEAENVFNFLCGK